MSAQPVTVRVDGETKLAATSIVKDFGFDLSSVARASYRQIVREQRIPLNLAYSKPNKGSLEATKEAEAIIASGKSGFDSVEAIFCQG